MAARAASRYRRKSDRIFPASETKLNSVYPSVNYVYHLLYVHIVHKPHIYRSTSVSIKKCTWKFKKVFKISNGDTMRFLGSMNSIFKYVFRIFLTYKWWIVVTVHISKGFMSLKTTVNTFQEFSVQCRNLLYNHVYYQLRPFFLSSSMALRDILWCLEVDTWRHVPWITRTKSKS
jgi:hypothetical protein